jgi:hypothetical protein
MMRTENFRDTALMMMRLHGLRALAVADRQASERRLRQDTVGFERWRGIDAAIRELRRTVPRASGRAAA